MIEVTKIDIAIFLAVWRAAVWITGGLSWRTKIQIVELVEEIDKQGSEIKWNVNYYIGSFFCTKND